MPKRFRTYEQQRSYDMKKRYGLTIDQWEAMLIEQSGRCEICSVPMWRPAVDHNHTTGRRRSLLCGTCNIGMGHIERPGFVEAAERYLRFHDA